jgi:hypothetical protein
LVERFAEVTFRRPPVVRAADAASWAELVHAEMPEARDPALAVAITFALYLAERDEVVLGPFLANGLMRAAKGDKGRDVGFAFPLLAHELTHALQEQHWQLPSRLRAADDGAGKRILKSLVEGHATWIEEQVASDLGIVDFAKPNREMHRRNGRMEYVRGRDYLANLHADGGMAAVLAALTGPLPDGVTFTKVSMRKAKAPSGGGK